MEVEREAGGVEVAHGVLDVELHVVGVIDGEHGQRRLALGRQHLLLLRRDHGHEAAGEEQDQRQVADEGRELSPRVAVGEDVGRVALGGGRYAVAPSPQLGLQRYRGGRFERDRRVGRGIDTRPARASAAGRRCARPAAGGWRCRRRRSSPAAPARRRSRACGRSRTYRASASARSRTPRCWSCRAYQAVSAAALPRISPGTCGMTMPRNAIRARKPMRPSANRTDVSTRQLRRSGSKSDQRMARSFPGRTPAT